jgi:hypothetical protein
MKGKYQLASLGDKLRRFDTYEMWCWWILIAIRKGLATYALWSQRFEAVCQRFAS